MSMSRDGRGAYHLNGRVIVRTDGKRPDQVCDGDMVIVTESCGTRWPDKWLRPVPARDLMWNQVQEVAL